MELELSLNQPKSIFKILKESGFLYIKNFVPFSAVMIYPILAHLIGVPYILYVGYHTPDIFPLETRDSMLVQIVALTFVATIPGFLLFLSGFWSYLIAMVSLNRFLLAKVNEDTSIVYSSCAEYVKNRKKTYFSILSFFMIIWIIGFAIIIAPRLLDFILPQIVIALISLLLLLLVMTGLAILSIYFSLAFQIFAFEELSVKDILIKSCAMIKGNFLRTTLLCIILAIITGVIVPLIIYTFLDLIGVVNLLSNAFLWLGNILSTSIEQLSFMYPGSVFDSIKLLLQLVSNPDFELAKSIIALAINSVITAGLLPLGSIAFTLLYYDIIFRKGCITE